MENSFDFASSRLPQEKADWDRSRLIWLGNRLNWRSSDSADVPFVVWLTRALLRVRNRSGLTVPLEANAAQLLYERARRQHNIVLKARQMGISTWIAGRFFLKTIMQPGTLTVQVAHSREAAQQIFRIVHRFYEHLPAGLREGVLQASRINAGQIYFPSIDSEYRVESAADCNAGRGMTIQNLHCSEVARWSGDAEETLASLRAALVPAGELVLESTPNGAYGCFYKEWNRAAAMGVTQHFFPWWLEPAYVGKGVCQSDWTLEEQKLAWDHALTEEQIGFRRMLQENFRQLAAQEYAEDPESCFQSSGSCVFDLQEIEARVKQLSPPVEKRRNDQLWLWYPPQPGMDYIVGVDPAGGGTDGDYSAAQVIERRSGLQCAELRGHLNPRELAKNVAALGKEYNQALLAIERNNHGSAVLAYLTETEHYPRIYEQRGQAGWLTTAISRPTMIERLGDGLSRSPEMFSSPRLLAECRAFIRHGDGRMSAAAGAHDDCVLAMAIAQMVRLEVPGGRTQGAAPACAER